MDQEIIKPYFLQLTHKDQKAALEAIIFASEEPITEAQLFKILLNFENTRDNANNNNNIAEFFHNDSNESEETSNNNVDVTIDTNLFRKLIEEINNELLTTNRPFQIVMIGGGYQFSTRKEYGEVLTLLNKSKSKRRLSHASLEVLAIIAYKQPITKPEIEQVRGVNSGEIVNSLLEKNLIETLGRKDTLGKPLLYGISNEFLKAFGINSLDDLPKLRELEEFSGFDLTEMETVEFKIDESLVPELAKFEDDSESEYISFEEAESNIKLLETD